MSAAIDPSRFGDPLALQTSWQPAASGGASFGTHRLRQSAGHRVEFVPTGAWKLFCLFFLGAGAGVLVWHLRRYDLDRIALVDSASFVPLIVGVVFVAAGAGMGWIGSRPRVFDRARGAYWRGRGEPAVAGTGAANDAALPLSAIHALQLLAERVRQSKSHYTSYELNLVLADGSRVNVVDHGNLAQLRSDARTLARFLDKPLWDAVGS